MVEPIRSNSLAAEAFERVTAAITPGEFEPGQKLSEVELARQLGISRGPVREALNQLEGRLVTRTPRVGVRVIQFGHEELQQLFHIREAIEGMADELCRLAKEFKRRVAARKLLPALASLSAVGPLHELLNQQLGSSLMAESVRVQDSPEVPDGPGDLPGYL